VARDWGNDRRKQVCTSSYGLRGSRSGSTNNSSFFNNFGTELSPPVKDSFRKVDSMLE
jgi:hypothetical protein